MKKLTIVASMAIVAAAFVSCGKSSPKADLKTDVDSLSYAIGMDRSQGIKQYLAQMQVDTAYMDEFVKGLNDGASAGDDKKKAAYNAGLSVGMQLQMMNKEFSRQIFAGDSTQTLSMKNFLAGFIAGTTGKNGKMSSERARQIEQIIAEKIMKKSTQKQYGGNKAKSEKFIAAMAKQPGVKKIGSVYYKVVKTGNGAIPAINDTTKVKVNYECKTMDGKIVDSSYKTGNPLTIGVKQVVPGFTEAIAHMPVGSKWIVYMPWDQAYGDRQMGQIAPYSALQFTIELLSVEK
jgi:FKBP-type peptidyl-prolyl cis-trans isomerase